MREGQGDAAPIPALPNQELDLGPIKAREAAAEAGPWSPYHFASPRGARSYWGVGCESRGLIGVASRIDHRSDAEFIAHARQDIPALLAEVERLRALVPSSQPETPTLDLVRYLTKRKREIEQVIEDYPQGGYQRELDILETLLDLVESVALPVVQDEAPKERTKEQVEHAADFSID